MAWNKCCCTCVIHQDGFDRSDGTPLRGRWCEPVGDYEIDAGRAKCLVAGSEAFLKVRHPVPEGRMFVHYTTVNENEDSGEKYRILLNVQLSSGCNSSNYYFAEFERNGIADSVIRVGICSGGVETILKEDDVIGLTGLGTRGFYAMIDENIICAGVDNAVLSQVAATHAGLFPNGYFSGFSLDTAGMMIDDFVFEKKENKDVLCADCLCQCDNKEWPETLNVRIYPDPSNCVLLDLLEPCEFQAIWNRVSGVWEGSDNCCGEGYGGEFFRVQVNCASGEGVAGELAIGLLNGCTASNGGVAPTVTNCDTLCATFGPLTVSPTDLACFCSSVPFDINDPLARGSCDLYVEVCA